MSKLKNTFYRPPIVNLEEFDRIVAKLREDILQIKTGNAESSEVAEYTNVLIKQGRDYKDRGILLWDLEDVERVCREGFIYYVAEPTRIAMAVLVNVRLIYPHVADGISGFDEALNEAIKGTVACGFFGHGYDSDRYLLKTMSELADWNIPYFLERYDCFELWQEFTVCKKYIEGKLEMVQNPSWFTDDTLVRKAKETIQLINESAEGKHVSG